MRTDSTRLSGEATKWVRDHIAETYGKEYLPPRPNVYSRSKGAQDAHEAIRPTYRELSPDKVKKHLTPQQFKLYGLIWNRFIACQMQNATFDTLTVDITGGPYTLRATAQKLRFDGFLRVYHEAKEPDENGNGNGADRALPDLQVGQPVQVKDVTPTQSFTKPPARYSEAMLVKRMEADGIGRPSTYATIISTLRDRKYVELVEKKLRPTELGTTVNKILVENFPDIFDVGFTASMEKELDQVEEGNDNWVKVVNDFYKPFMATIEDLKGREKEIKASMTEQTDITCDKCGSPMVIKWGRNGRFLACSAYPDCKNTRPLPEEEAASRTDEKCEKCGSPMVIKTGRFGRFLACSAYPDCKNTKPVTLGIACPRENCDGKLVEKQSRGRRVFYGCSRYPKCDYATWDRPVDIACPMCKHPFMVQKESKAKGEYYRCPQCKHEQAVEKAEAAKEA
jgi:DNA topoisomerase-1